jgi:hypothetical protein
MHFYVKIVEMRMMVVADPFVPMVLLGEIGLLFIHVVIHSFVDSSFHFS